MNNRDVTQRISGDILQHQLQLAKNATPGEWYDAGNGIIAAKRGARTPNPVAQVDNEKDAAHIIANSPDVVITIINEILRLRAENERLKAELVGAIEVMERLLASKPGGVYFQKYQGGLQVAIRSAKLVLSAAARKAVEEACPKK